MLMRDKKAIFPIQPAYSAIGSDYQECFFKWNPLTQNTAVLFQFRVPNNQQEPFYLLPDGCVELLFSCEEDNANILFFGKRTKPREIHLKPGVVYFGFRPFYEAGFKLKDGTYLSLIDDMTLLNHDSELMDLNERLIRCRSFYTRCRLFQLKNVQRLFYDVNYQADFVVECSWQICSSYGQIKIGQLGELLGYTDRHLRRSYKNTFGVSPNLYKRIIRLQHSVHLFSQATLNSLDNVALISAESGYYDQSHLNYEYKSFTGLSMQEVMAKIHFAN